MNILFFATPSDFRAWLQTSHQSCLELWVGFYKKSSGKPSITYPQALDEALCFGWIDGVRKSLADDSYIVRFTPRKPKSQWSAINIKRTQALIKAARMHPAGLGAFEGATGRSRKPSYEERNGAVFDVEAEGTFRANREAWDFFRAQPPGYRRLATFWVISAKKEETQRKRLASLIADSERGQRMDPMNPLNRPAVPKRQEK